MTLGLAKQGVNFTPSGDLSGNATDQTVVGIQTIPVNNTPPSTGQALVFNGSQWVPTDQSGTLNGDVITTSNTSYNNVVQFLTGYQTEYYATTSNGGICVWTLDDTGVKGTGLAFNSGVDTQYGISELWTVSSGTENYAYNFQVSSAYDDGPIGSLAFGQDIPQFINEADINAGNNPFCLYGAQGTLSFDNPCQAFVSCQGFDGQGTPSGYPGLNLMVGPFEGSSPLTGIYIPAGAGSPGSQYVEINGSIHTPNISLVTFSPYQLDSAQAIYYGQLGNNDDYIVLVDTVSIGTSSLIILNSTTYLGPVSGRQVIIKDSTGSAATNNIVILDDHGMTIDGSSGYTISSNYGLVQLVLVQSTPLPTWSIIGRG